MPPTSYGTSQEEGIALGRKTGIGEESASDLAALLEELKRGDLPPDVFTWRLRSLLDHRAQAIPFLLRQFESDDEEGTASTGWDTFLDAVIRAGLARLP